ncbi:MAG: hypothetical protein IJV95_03395 [Clostridia bacterium]|nr:hypothetical protein [Clostridia bacterium]
MASVKLPDGEGQINEYIKQSKAAGLEKTVVEDNYLTHEGFIKNGEKIIADLIKDVKAEGQTTVVIAGNYLISDTIYIPSNTTLLLKDCHLRLADGVYCNMFKNERCELELEYRTRENADRNIKIIGEGRAVIDGGNYNGLSERTQNTNGLPSIWKNNSFFFSNMENFEIRNLKVINQRWWAFHFNHCRRGKICDIEFLADYTRYIDGKRILGLDRAVCDEVYARNADGIDLRIGCHDIIIENITGFVQDDSVALTALARPEERRYYVEGETNDIYNVIIRNVMTSAFHSNVRLLNQYWTAPAKLYNILVDGVVDTSVDEKYYVGRSAAAVRVGDVHKYGERHSYANETYNIVIKNVFARGMAGVKLVGDMTNVKCENICGYDGCPNAIDAEHAKLF